MKSATRSISFAFYVILLSADKSSGNPIMTAANIPARAYITSEHLEVTVSPTKAEFKGTFTFAAQNLNSENKDERQTFMLVPVWFPQQKSSNSLVNKFWEVFCTNTINLVRPTNSQALEKAVGLKIVSGKEAIPINAFIALYQGENPSGFPVFRSFEWQPFLQNQESGFCCLLFRVDGLGELLKSNVPITVSYRQPLLEDAGEKKFFYMPFFENLPASISTMDTNQYAITLVASGCKLKITTGEKNLKLQDGKSVILAPKDRQAIRATVIK